MKKMFKSQLILILVLFVSFSCTKKNNDPATITCKAPSFTYASLLTSKIGSGSPISSTGSGTFTYNSEGKIISSSATYSDGLKITFVYSGNTVTFTRLDGAGKITYVATYTLNSDGYVSQEVYGSYTNGVANATNTKTYEYDSNGYLVKTITTNGSNIAISVYTYVDGNFTSITTTSNSSPTTQNITNYEYYTDKVNTGSLDLYVKLGKPTKNLLKKETANTVNFLTGLPAVLYTRECEYTLDSRNNVTQVIQTYTSTSFVDKYTSNYVFECN